MQMSDFPENLVRRGRNLLEELSMMADADDVVTDELLNALSAWVEREESQPESDE
jgi:hypothetical protein